MTHRRPWTLANVAVVAMRDEPVVVVPLVCAVVTGAFRGHPAIDQNPWQAAPEPGPPPIPALACHATRLRSRAHRGGPIRPHR
ncbi:hypothetical protein SBRY_40313 [Actinacidiphila bryophytorum]|uniref:Uncharacterized protein n=1 Tax=Actinacidiphila bryophytorum TaxID=1436133 RepID=A0A9W4H2M9_9ACTN|nr:hypothetical protein SBRY_40313 [Actinacidiphila bryophytorum]